MQTKKNVFLQSVLHNRKGLYGRGPTNNQKQNHLDIKVIIMQEQAH